MPPNLAFSEAEIAPADRLGSLRSSNGRKPMNAMPAFGLLVKPLIDRPGNATALSKPGSFMAMVAHAADHRFGAIKARRIRQLRKGHQVLFVLGRHEAGRRGAEAQPGHGDQAGIDQQAPRCCRE